MSIAPNPEAPFFQGDLTQHDKRTTRLNQTTKTGTASLGYEHVMNSFGILFPACDGRTLESAS